MLRTASKVLALKDEQVRIYAFNKVLHIESEQSKLTEYQLFDLSGRLKLKVVVNGSANINLGHLANGVYLLSDGLKSKKILLK